MTPEKRAWERAKKMLQALRLDPVRVENMISAGTPDVNYSHGWIEMKAHGRWKPGRDGTLKIDTLLKRKAQVPWLTRRWLFGGNSWVWIDIAGDILLFSGFDSRDVRAGLSPEDLRMRAIWTFNKGEIFDAEPQLRLHCWLCGHPEGLPLNEQARYMRLRRAKTVSQTASALDVSEKAINAAETSIDPLTVTLLNYWNTM